MIMSRNKFNVLSSVRNKDLAEMNCSASNKVKLYIEHFALIFYIYLDGIVTSNYITVFYSEC